MKTKNIKHHSAFYDHQLDMKHIILLCDSYARLILVCCLLRTEYTNFKDGIRYLIELHELLSILSHKEIT